MESELISISTPLSCLKICKAISFNSIIDYMKEYIISFLHEGYNQNPEKILNLSTCLIFSSIPTFPYIFIKKSIIFL